MDLQKLSNLHWFQIWRSGGTSWTFSPPTNSSLISFDTWPVSKYFSSRRKRKVRDIRYLLRHEWARTNTKRKETHNDLMIELFCLNFQQTRTFSVYMKAKRGNFQKVIKMSGVLFANSKPIHRTFISIVSIESDLGKNDIH